MMMKDLRSILMVAMALFLLVDAASYNSVLPGAKKIITIISTTKYDKEYIKLPYYDFVVSILYGVFFGEYFYAFSCIYPIFNIINKITVVTFQFLNWDNRVDSYLWVTSNILDTYSMFFIAGA